MPDSFRYLKNFEFFTADEIITQLNTSCYQNNYRWFQTYIPPNRPELIRPSDEFETNLVKQNIFYFAYVKFFQFDGISYGLVAGKTKSRLVNSKRGSDVTFTTDCKYAPKTKWNSKEFLTSNHLEWDKERILVIQPWKTPAQEGISELEFRQQLKENEASALEIEAWLTSTFHLFNS